MEPFRILEHTADVGFEAFGKTLEEVFANAARALTDLLVDLDSIQTCQELPIDAQGADLGGLLVNFLSEVLFLADAESWLFREFDVRLEGDRALRAIARGEKLDRSRHQTKTLVKAITYHQLLLAPVAGGWRAQVYVDV